MNNATTQQTRKNSFGSIIVQLPSIQRLFLILSLLTIIACKKSVVEAPDPLSSVQENQINQMLEMNTAEARLAFNLLDNATKLAFSKRKLQIISNHSSLNEFQREVVNQVISSLNINIYKDGPEKIKFKATAEVLLVKINRSFSRDEIIAYFFDLGKTKFPSPTKGNIVKPRAEQPSFGGDCHCHIGSAFALCSNGCNYTYGCTRSEMGCGFIGIWPCDGKC